MIEKIEVRKRLARYEQKLREEKDAIDEELRKKKDACLTADMEVIWRQSAEYAKLFSKWQTLHEVILDIIDIRCEEIFNNYQ